MMKPINDFDPIGWLAGGCNLKSPVIVIPSDHDSRSRDWLIQPQYLWRNKMSVPVFYQETKNLHAARFSGHLKKALGLTVLHILPLSWNIWLQNITFAWHAEYVHSCGTTTDLPLTSTKVFALIRNHWWKYVQSIWNNFLNHKQRTL